MDVADETANLLNKMHVTAAGNDDDQRETTITTQTESKTMDAENDHAKGGFDEHTMEDGLHTMENGTLDSDRDDSAAFDCSDMSNEQEKERKTGRYDNENTLSHYRRPENTKPVPVFVDDGDDLSFDSCSASQTYENFIKEAYSKVQRQVEQSRSMIEANILQEVGGYAFSGALDTVEEGRPIRSYARHNDTTHEFESRSDWNRRKLKSEDSTSDFSESGCTDDASSSSNDDRVPRTWEANSLYGNRRYYSRFDQSKDADYFDFDLNHSVDLFRKPKLTAAPRAPTYFEHKLFKDKNKIQGNSTISQMMFRNNDESESKGYKSALQTSFISSALRTPSYWEYRYQHMNGSPHLKP